MFAPSFFESHCHASWIFLFCRPNPLQYFLVPDIEVEKSGDDDHKDDLEEEEEVDENVSLPHTTSDFFH